MSRFRVGLADGDRDDRACRTWRLHRGRRGGERRSHSWGRHEQQLARAVGTDNPATNTFTLTADCGEVDVAPDGSGRLHGGGRRARDHRHRPCRRTSFNGGVVTNAQGPGAHVMHVNNVIIQAVGFAVHGCAFPPGGPGVQVGLFFDDADGTATNVTVLDITQHSGCQTGNGIRANARAGIARTVTLNGVTVTGFMKNGVTGSGQMTLNVCGNSNRSARRRAGFEHDQRRPVRRRRRRGHVHGQHGDRRWCRHPA